MRYPTSHIAWVPYPRSIFSSFPPGSFSFSSSFIPFFLFSPAFILGNSKYLKQNVDNLNMKITLMNSQAASS